MTDRPIIFSAPMIRALLEGRKTMTRRALNPQPLVFDVDGKCCEVAVEITNGEAKIRTGRVITRQRLKYAPGDQLWVRETHVIEDTREYDEIAETPADGRPVRTIQRADEGAWREIPHYRATEPEPHIVAFDRIEGDDDRTRWRSPIHMPRWASRLTLTVTAVKIERLQDISEDDAVAEGATKRAASYGFRSRDEGWSMDWSEVGGLSRFGSGEQVGKSKRLTESDVSLSDARSAFGSFINHLHGGKNWNLKPTNLWAANPWVAAISFTVARRNIDEAKP